jgi:plastocyanin domain-containing protein
MSRHGRSYAGGGVASGPNSGYGATLHGTEAVVPLPNNRTIPVELSGKNSGPVNTTINVNMGDGSSNTTTDEETGKQFAQAINMAVLEEIGKQQRPGGLLAG